MYGSRREWFDHEAHLHRMQWICEACKQSFTSKGDFVKHVQRHHSDSFSEQQLPALLDMCSRPADDKVVGKCSFCFKEGQPLRRHMAHHMNALALFTLPGRDDNEGADNESNKGEAGATESETSSKMGREASSDLSTSDVMSEISQGAKTEIMKGSETVEEREFGLDPTIESAEDLTHHKPHYLLEHTGDFWDRAYHVSSQQEQWRSYENFLWQGIEGVTPQTLTSMSKSERDGLMTGLFLNKAEILENPRWQVIFHHDNPELRRIMRFVLHARNLSSREARENPRPALAWTGILMLLPTRLDYLIDSDGMEDAFDLADIGEALEYISTLINRVTIIQDIYFGERIDFALSTMDGGSQVQKSFEDSMTDLCAAILDCEAQAICSLLLERIPVDKSPLPTLVANLKEKDAASQNDLGIVESDKVKVALRAQVMRMNELLNLQKLKWQEQETPNQKSAREEIQPPSRQQIALNECLDALRTNSYERSKNLIPDRAPGTCEWFLKHPVYHDWLEARSSNILWLTAESGYGKSVLMKSLIDNELASIASVTTCYFFFKDDGVDRKNIIYALLALLHQLCSQNPALLSRANETFQLNGGKITHSFRWLWDLLVSLAKCPEAGKIICILDGLDECEEARRQYIIAALNSLHADFETTKSHLKFLLTSRRFSDLEDLEPKILRLSGDNERQAMQQEVGSEIKRRLSRIFASRALNQELGTAFEVRLLQVQAPTHLWLHLVFTAIMVVRGSWQSTSEFLKYLPQNAGEAYETLLELSPEREQATKLLQVVVAAERHLTVRELNMAINIQEGQTSRDEVDLLPEANFATYVDTLCHSIVRVYEGKIYLFHQTVKEWWKMKTNPAKSSTSSGDTTRIVENPHRVLAKICLLYISFDVFEDKPLAAYEIEDGKPDWYKLQRREIASYVRGFDFLSYAATFWPLHYRSIHDHDESLVTWWFKACKPQSNRLSTWFRVFWYAHGTKDDLGAQEYKVPKLSSLILASFLGHISVVKYLVAQGGILEINQALITAINRGNTSIAIHLIDSGASMEAEAVEDVTPLNLAATRGLLELAQSIVERGANIRQQTHLRGITALGSASANGHVAIVELLLHRSADPNTTKNDGWTPLMEAVWNGHQRVAEVLIRAGADVRACDHDGHTALHKLNTGCDESFVRLLMENGAEVNVQDVDGRTPLSWAAQRCPRSVARTLLQNGSHVDSRDDDGITPLLYALQFGNHDVVRELLTAGADANASDRQGLTALAHALRLSSNTATEELLNAGADPNITDESGQTPLMQSLPNLQDLGLAEHIHCLVRAGADVDVADQKGRTTLSYAVERNTHSVIRALLEAKASPNVIDQEGRTPLHYAAARSLTVVKLLMKVKADVSIRDHQGKTPIDIAKTKDIAALMKDPIDIL